MRLSRLSNRQLRSLLKHGEVRFAIPSKFFNRDGNPYMYKQWLEGVVESCIHSLSGGIIKDWSFELYKISPDVQRKIKAQIAKIVTELKKLPGVVK